MIGRELAHFQILEELGSGGMGTVYRAFDIELERTVALKVLPPHALANEEARQRFRREARAASALNHPGIVTVHEIGSEDGVDYLVMEKVEGRTLRQELATGALPIAKALSFALQIAEALAAAHAQGVVHRDLKPGNLMITPDGRLKILDFGLAKRLSLRTSPPIPGVDDLPTRRLEEALQTASGVILGTPHFMAPEQAEGGEVDARSDVFAFGCILYQMLAGEPPFRGESPVSVLTSILRDEPTPLTSHRPDLPEPLTRLVAGCLEKAPRKRPANGSALVARLRPVQDTLSSADRIATRTSLRPVRRSPRAFLRVSVAVFVATLLIVLWVALRHESPGETNGFELRLARLHPVSDRGGEWQARFSPDGRLLAYVSRDAAGVPQVWVRRLAGGDPVQATRGASPAGHPAWSVDGETLFFSRPETGIWTVPAFGGSERQLLAEGSLPIVDASSGRLLFQRQGRLFLAESDGTREQALPGTEGGYFGNLVGLGGTFSPDGAEVAFFKPGDSPFGDLWLLAIDDRTTRRLTDLEFMGGEPVWTRQGRALVYSSTAGGTLNLWWLDPKSGASHPLTVGTGEDSEPAVSPDGRSIVYTNRKTTYSLARLDPTTGSEVRLLARPEPIGLPDVSPDGRRVAFFGPTTDGVHLFVVDADGSNLLQVTTGEGSRQVTPRWSRDGSHLYYYRQRPAPAFARIPASGGESQTVVAGWSWTRESFAVVDPKEERVAVSIFEEGEIVGCRVREIASGRDWELPERIGGVVWSPDGETLFGSTARKEIFRCRGDGSSCERVGSGYLPRWGPDGRLYVARFEPSGGSSAAAAIFSLDVAGAGNPDRGEGAARERRIGRLENVEYLTFGFDVFPDGSVVWSQVERDEPKLWTADLLVE